MAMTWTTFHRRGEVLRTVIDTLDARGDGILPMDLAGVSATFDDELELLGALQLRWYTRLSGHLERALMHQPADTDEAVLTAWHATADELPGVRAALDRHSAEAGDGRMRNALDTASAKEHALLGAASGRHGVTVADTAVAGRLLEERARSTYRPLPATPSGHRGLTLLGRLKARVAA
jgi:hypothetical protein